MVDLGVSVIIFEESTGAFIIVSPVDILSSGGGGLLLQLSAAVATSPVRTIAMGMNRRLGFVINSKFIVI